jgi:hypothetical protein
MRLTTGPHTAATGGRGLFRRRGNAWLSAKVIKTTYADDYNWGNITFDEDLFSHDQISYGTRNFTHASAGRVLTDAIRLN